MSIVLSPGIISVHQSLNSIGTMASKRAWSKDTIESTTGDVVDQVSMRFPIYEDTNFLIDKKMKITW